MVIRIVAHHIVQTPSRTELGRIRSTAWPDPGTHRGLVPNLVGAQVA